LKLFGSSAHSGLAVAGAEIKRLAVEAARRKSWEVFPKRSRVFIQNLCRSSKPYPSSHIVARPPRPVNHAGPNQSPSPPRPVPAQGKKQRARIEACWLTMVVQMMSSTTHATTSAISLSALPMSVLPMRALYLNVSKWRTTPRVRRRAIGSRPGSMVYAAMNQRVVMSQLNVTQT
jgi:hypothetical protein